MKPTLCQKQTKSFIFYYVNLLPFQIIFATTKKKDWRYFNLKARWGKTDSKSVKIVPKTRKLLKKKVPESTLEITPQYCCKNSSKIVLPYYPKGHLNGISEDFCHKMRNLVFEADFGAIENLLRKKAPRCSAQRCVLPVFFRSIHYCHSSKSTRKESGKTHLCVQWPALFICGQCTW